MFTQKAWRAGVLAALSTAMVHASTLQDFLQESHVTGAIRNYYFTQDFGGAQPDTSAYSLGGMLKITTPPVAGASAGLAFYTANALGANDLTPPFARLDPLLMGNTGSLNVLGQAYLQFHDRWTTVRAGDQLLDTPWMGPADAFMIPNTFEAVYAGVHPLPGISIEGLRALRYKNRTALYYGEGTLLNVAPETSLYPHLAAADDGALGLGIRIDGNRFHLPGTQGQVWFYQFYNLAKLYYGTAGYRVPTGTFAPFADFQYARERASGARAAGPVNATVYGAMAGITGPRGQVFAAYDAIPREAPFSPGGIRTLYNGGFLSPYTQPYNADPLYTTIMDYGLVGASSPGHAWKFGFVIHPIHALRLKYSYSLYDTAPYVLNVYANCFSAAYSLGGYWKGLTLRDRLAIDNGFHSIGNTPTGTLIDNRIMLQYTF